MLVSLVFWGRGNVKKSNKTDEISWNWRRKSSSLLNDMMNFNEIFEKKSYIKPELNFLSRKYIFGKPPRLLCFLVNNSNRITFIQLFCFTISLFLLKLVIAVSSVLENFVPGFCLNAHNVVSSILAFLKSKFF